MKRRRGKRTSFILKSIAKVKGGRKKKEEESGKKTEEEIGGKDSE